MRPSKYISIHKSKTFPFLVFILHLIQISLVICSDVKCHLESVELRLRAGNSRLQRGLDMLEKSADQEI